MLSEGGGPSCGRLWCCSGRVFVCDLFLLHTLYVEYAERTMKYGILVLFSLFYEYIPHEYVQVPVIYRVYQAEYVICLVAVPGIRDNLCNT